MKKTSSLAKKLAAYSAAATIAVGAGLAHGADRLTTVNQMVVNDTLDIDFDGDMNPEFFVAQVVLGGGTPAAYFGVASANGDGGLSFMTNMGYVARLAFDDPIAGSTFTNRGSTTVLLGEASSFGYFINQTGYVGVRFTLDSPPATTFSGWVELSVNADSSEITVIRYYYEDASANTALRAGQTPTAVTMSDVVTTTASNPVGVMALLTGALAALSGLGLWVRERVFGRE